MRLGEIGFCTADYEEMIYLRDLVLRKPLGLAFSADDLAKEYHLTHLGLWINDHLIACLVLQDLGSDVIKMRQVAVHPDTQGQGLGARLVSFSEAFARKRQYKTMTLNARDTAIKFYTKLGYAIVGEGFTEVGIPHHKMSKTLGL